MLNKVISQFSERFVILLFLMLFIFSTTFASEYTVPRAAYSVYAEDLDLDGDNDIVVGHNYNSQTEWGGVSILQNNGEGEFTLIDSIYLYSWQTNIYANIINNDEYPDIIGRHFEDDNQYIAILENNQGIYIPNYYTMEYGISDFVTGDIDNDNDIDIVIASNNGQFWGILYNDGTGQFSLPEYTFVDYYPGGIACEDLNNDGRDDIVVCGLKLEVYLSYPDSFQYILVDETDFQNEIKIEDINNNGNKDLIVSRYGAPHLLHFLQIYENQGNSDFSLVYEEEITVGIFKMQLTDLNNDNLFDIIYVKDAYLNQVFVRFNCSNCSFSEEISYLTNDYCYNCFSADLDGNFWNDIITTHYSHNFLSGNLHVLFNDGSGNFVEEPQVEISNNEIQNPNVKMSNYPNPFKSSGVGRSPGTTISYDLPVNIENPVVEIFNIKGQRIKQFSI
ncbi:MAG: VCBS repeat-containing protein, partial [Candidatus Cloacimonetes bacterium]|nr:VCBS repeat-containing protein [Candidatus Cloacimonadota bacterium]